MKNQRSILSDFWLIISIMAFGIIIFCSWYSYEFYNIKTKNILATLEDKTRHIAATMTDDVDYVSYQMEFVGKQISSMDENDKNAIYKLLAFTKTNHRVNNSITWNMFSWSDKTYQLTVDGEAGVLEEPKDLSIRDYIPKTVQTPWQIHLGKPVHGAVSRQWMIPAGMGYERNGNYIGAVVFGFEMGSLITKLEKGINTPGISFSIVDENFKIIANSRNNNSVLFDEAIIYSIKNAQNNGSQESATKQSLFDESSFYSYSTKLQKYPYTIVTTFDPLLASQQFKDGLYTRLAEFLALSILCVGVLWVIRMRFVSPIKQLSNAALQIANGQEVMLPTSKISEINHLSEQLESVQEYIKKNREIKERLEKTENASQKAYKAKSAFLKLSDKKIKRAHDVIVQFTNNIQKDTQTSSYLYEADADEVRSNIIGNIEKIALSIESVDVAEVIKTCVDIFGQVIYQSNLNVEYSAEESIGIQTDNWRLHHVVGSLLYNAIIQTPNDGRISIHTSHDNDYVYILIEDHGVGLIGEHEEKLRSYTEGTLKGNIHDIPSGLDFDYKRITRLVQMLSGNIERKSSFCNGTVVSLRLPKKQILSDNDNGHKPKRKPYNALQ